MKIKTIIENLENKGYFVFWENVQITDFELGDKYGLVSGVKLKKFDEDGQTSFWCDKDGRVMKIEYVEYYTGIGDIRGQTLSRSYSFYNLAFKSYALFTDYS